MSGVQSISNSPYQYTSAAAGTPPQPTLQNPFLDPNGPFANLNLTAAQQQQIAQIFQNTTATPQSLRALIDQIDTVLTPVQQQTLQNDLQVLHAHRPRDSDGDADGSSASTNPLAGLNLSSTQQRQIGQILQSAQTNGTSPADVIKQIDSVLTTSQQQQLASLFAAYTSAGAGGTTGSPIQPYVINATA